MAGFVGHSSLLPGYATGRSLDTEIGRIDLLQPMDGPVDVLLRPEHVSVKLAAEGHGRVGEVVRREYFGWRQSLSVRMPSGAVIETTTGADAALPVGAMVEVSTTTPTVAFPAIAAS